MTLVELYMNDLLIGLQRTNLSWCIRFVAWMDKYPISYVAISEGDSLVLVALAHFYVVVVTLAIIFPGIDLPLATPIRLESIIKVDQALRRKPGVFCTNCKAFHCQNELMAFPLNAVYVYRELQGSKFKANG